jgi:hypothetical protein
MRALATFLIDEFLRIIEAAAALNVAPVAGVGGLNCDRSASRGLPDLILRDAVADADDHEAVIAIMRTIRN